jgi:hypothetical protein
VKYRVLIGEIIPDMTQVVKPVYPILDTVVSMMYTAIGSRGRKFNFRLKK